MGINFHMLHPLSQTLIVSQAPIPLSLSLKLKSMIVFSHLFSLWCWGDQSSTIAKTQLTHPWGGWLDENPATPRVEEADWIMPLCGFFFFFFFGLWIWYDFGLLVVVDMILMVLWLMACGGCGLWGVRWWWRVLMLETFLLFWVLLLKHGKLWSTGVFSDLGKGFGNFWKSKAWVWWLKNY